MKNNIVETFKQNNFDTDKYDLGYLDNFYLDFFKSNEKNINNILEIGINRGGSILLWKTYFKNANIYGVDIKGPIDIEGAKTYKSNAYDKKFTSRFEDNYFDLIIDDGPHTYSSWLKVIDLYYNKISPGGFLIIEDIIYPKGNMGATKSQIDSIIEFSKSKGFSSCEQKLMMGFQKNERLLNLWSKHLSILVLKK